MFGKVQGFSVAGRISVAVEGEIVDGESGKVLMKFKHDSKSGAMSGSYGGRSKDFVEKDSENIASQIAEFLKHLRDNNTQYFSR